MERIHTDRSKQINAYLLAMCLTSCMAFLYFIVFRGKYFYAVFHNYESDTFMDFFNCIYHAIFNPYREDHQDIYPALVNLIWKVLAHIIPTNIRESQSAVEMRGDQYALVIFFVFYMLGLWSTAMCIKGKSRLGKFGESVLTLAVLCSYPMLFAVERGNIIILALVFTMVFVFFRNSENRVLRELSYISLAVAAAIKIYPAILGVLLLREKKFKDAARLTIYGIVMFFVPFFLFYDGVNSLKYMLEGFISVSGWDRGCGVQYSLHNLGAIVERLLAGHSPEKLLKVCKTAFSVLVVGGLLGSAFLVREEWKRILALVLIMILLPNISYTYTLIFLIVPLVLFLNVWHGAEEGLSVRDKAYAVCFFVLMVPIVTPSLPQFQDDIFPFTYGMLADYLALLTMVFLLFWDAVSGLRATRSHSGADMQHGI